MRNSTDISAMHQSILARMQDEYPGMNLAVDVPEIHAAVGDISRRVEDTIA